MQSCAIMALRYIQSAACCITTINAEQILIKKSLYVSTNVPSEQSSLTSSMQSCVVVSDSMA